MDMPKITFTLTVENGVDANCNLTTDEDAWVAAVNLSVSLGFGVYFDGHANMPIMPRPLSFNSEDEDQGLYVL